jgi:hypothetical protein
MMCSHNKFGKVAQTHVSPTKVVRHHLASSKYGDAVQRKSSSKLKVDRATTFSPSISAMFMT